MRRVILSLFFLGFVFWLDAQDQAVSNKFSDAPWQNPSVASQGKWQPRPEFISYEARDHADRRNPDKVVHYLPLKGLWRVKYSTTAEGGAPGFYKPSFSVASWSQTEIPDFVTKPDAKNPFEDLVPPQLPARIPLAQYRAEIDVPYIWLDRDMFVHIEGVGGAHALYINNHRVGYGEDSRTPAEYNISDYVTDGLNSVGIEVYGYSTGGWMETALPQPSAGTLGNIYVYSQPKLRIEDFVISTKPDTTGKHTWVDIKVILSNSYKSAEDITLGYDLYSPAGNLLTFNLIDATAIPRQGHDTVYYREILYNTQRDKLTWSPENPNLYKLMLYIRRGGNRITEYIPLYMGIKWVEVRNGDLYINDSKASLKAVNYNSALDEATTKKELTAIKSKKFNTIYVSYPQPRWFYDLCDQIGLYVVDQANINSGFRTQDRTVGGSVANDPRFLPAFLDRTAYMQGRSKNYVSVIALSMGGKSGNGYNFYKAYQWLNGYDTLHPITYRDVQGEWNSDFQLPEGIDAHEILR